MYKTKRTQNDKMHTQTHTHTQKASVLYWPTTSEHGAYTSMWLICPVSFHYKRLIFPFPSRCQLQISSWLGIGLSQ